MIQKSEDTAIISWCYILTQPSIFSHSIKIKNKTIWESNHYSVISFISVISSSSHVYSNYLQNWVFYELQSCTHHVYRIISNWCTEIYLKWTIEFCKKKRLHASFLNIFNGTLRKSIALRSIYVGRLLQNIYHQPCMFKISQIIVIVLNLTAHESC